MTGRLPIALDAMGGDNAPDAVVRGAIDAATQYECDIILVGKSDVVTQLLDQANISPEIRSHLSVVDATEVVEMDEHPANAVRQKHDSSLVRACALVAEGKAGASVSAGNSGAMLAAALFVQKRLDGVHRPAIATLFPSATGHTLVIDSGANADCKPEWLAQFAVMGSVYAKSLMNITNPRVGLLSNGEEPSKGSQLVQDAYPLIGAAPVNFIGNVEGKNLFNGSVDVVVTDGFTGNIALKTAEGVGEFLFAALRREASSSFTAKIGGVLLKPRLRGLRDSVDYRHTGGSLLLGVHGETVIAHGRSDALAITNAIRVAREAIAAGVSSIIASEMSAMNPSPAGATS